MMKTMQTWHLYSDYRHCGADARPESVIANPWIFRAIIAMWALPRVQENHSLRGLPSFSIIFVSTLALLVLITNSYMPWWMTSLDKQEKKEKGISFSSIYKPVWSSELSIGGELLLLAGQWLPMLGHLAGGASGSPSLWLKTSVTPRFRVHILLRNCSSVRSAGLWWMLLAEM